MKLFIDADSILFKAACTQDNSYETRQVVKNIIQDTINDCWADETYLAVKGKGNFRYNIFEGYKASRKDKPMDEKLRDRLNDSYKYCLLYTSPSPRDGLLSRMPSSA